MRLVKAAKASPHAKFYNLSTASKNFSAMRYLEHILPTGIIEANVIKPMTPKR